MNFYVSRTQKGIKEFPMHKHNDIEIAFYQNTKGIVRTPDKDYPFLPGDTVIIPPGVYHSSYTDTELDAIYLKGNFNLLFHLSTPMVVEDNRNNEGCQLVTLLYNNRFSNREYLLSLCDAFIHFLALKIDFKDETEKTVNGLIEEFTRLSFEPDLNPSEILRKSGYAEDYIRSKFKKVTGKTPTAFITDIRINHACFLMETYGNSLNFSEIAEASGYTDYVYFSKRFKEVTGVSPREYRRRY